MSNQHQPDFAEDDIAEALDSKKKVQAPLIASSFTPVKQSSIIEQELSPIDPETPCYLGQNQNGWASSQQDTAQLGKYFRPEGLEA